MESVVDALERQHYPFISDTQTRMRRGMGNASRMKTTSNVSISDVQGVSDPVRRALHQLGANALLGTCVRENRRARCRDCDATLTSVEWAGDDRQMGYQNAKATHATRSSTGFIEHGWTYSFDLSNAMTQVRERSLGMGERERELRVGVNLLQSVPKRS